MFIFKVYCMLVLVNRPYRHEYLDIMDAISNMSLVMAAAIAGSFGDGPVWNNTVISQTLIAVSVVVAGYMLLVWAVLARQKLYAPPLGTRPTRIILRPY